MGMSAATMEKAIDRAVLSCTSLRAVGLWFKMFNVIKANRTNDTQPTEDQFSLSLDRLASMVGPSKATHDERRANARRIISSLRRLRVDDEPLIQRRGREYVCLPLLRVDRERWRVREAGKRNPGTPKALINADERYLTPDPASTPKPAVSPGNGEGVALINAPPPMVFPPTSPLSLPPNSLSAREEISGRPDPDEIPDEIVQLAFSAFDLWSRKSRQYGLIDIQNEHRKVREMLTVVSQNPPVILPTGTAAKQQNVVPQAVEVLIRQGKDFKSISFACGCVRTTLEDWQRTGMPGAKPQRANGAHRPSIPSATKTVLRDYGPELARKGTP